MRALAISLALMAPPLAAQDVAHARYITPTDAYGHGAIEGGEYAALEVTLTDGSTRSVQWTGAVFEDTAPRLYDFDGDGAPEIVTVLSGFDVGAKVQLLTSQDGQITPAGSNAPIGQRNRWLAIAGIADFDGNGVPEIAYVDRPHLAKELVYLEVEMADGQTAFREVARLKGLTNHHLGAPDIEGGVRLCAGHPPVVVTADAAWQTMVEVVWDSGKPAAKSIGPYTGAAGFAPHLRCD